MSKATKSVFAQILENGIELLQRPFVEKRVKRAFESAKDSLEEQLMQNESAILKAQENLVNAAKQSENLQGSIQSLINLRVNRASLKQALEALEEEISVFM